MDLRALRLQALVLRTLPYGENDLVVHLLARGLGRVPAFARGARKSQKRFGPLEPFQLFEIPDLRLSFFRRQHFADISARHNFERFERIVRRLTFQLCP